MTNHSAVFALLTTVLFFVISSSGLESSNCTPKCQMGDDKCAAQILTHLIRKTGECFKIKVPKNDPFEVADPFVLQSTRLTSLLTSKIYWSNIKVYGFDKFVALEYSFRPDQPITEIRAKTLLPKCSFYMDTNGDWKIISLSIKPRGSVVVDMENLEGNVIFKIDVVQRNGSEYMVISDTSVTIDISSFRIQYQYENVPTAITNLVSGVVNSNWKTIISLVFPTSNRFIGDILQKSIVQPIFDEFSLPDLAKEFYYMNSTCENV